MNLRPLLNIFIIVLTFVLIGCSSSSKSKETEKSIINPLEVDNHTKNKSLISEGNTVKTRYLVPEGFDRVSTSTGSFEEFLQTLPLKATDTPTKLYNGKIRKENHYFASSVVDMDLDTLNLQHAHQSIIRLRAEYLYQTQQFDKISFIIKNNTPFDYIQWLQGYRIESKESDLKLKKMLNKKANDYETFREYLREVFKHTDAESFKRNLHLIKDDDDNNEFGIGTIIMSKKPPYDAMIVVDMIEMNNQHPYSYMMEPGVLVAHGDSPAQEIEIIRATMDGLGVFPGNRGDIWEENAGSIWITHTKGERQIQKQGGNIDISLTALINKELFKFNDYDK